MADTTKITRHGYQRDPASGAGNCWCGWARDTIVHPHEPVGSYTSGGMKCVCGKPWNHSIHGSGERVLMQSEAESYGVAERLVVIRCECGYYEIGRDDADVGERMYEHRQAQWDSGEDEAMTVRGEPTSAEEFVESWLAKWGVEWPDRRAEQLVGDLRLLTGDALQIRGR